MTRAKKASLLGLAIVVVASAALLFHASVFDYICDDAFITLRYSKNLATLGSPIYNVGEHVEGYTSFLWMALTALEIRAGVAPELSVHLLGGFSGVLLMASTWLLWRRIEPRRMWAGVFPLTALAVSAPVAAWTLGGLETPLFAALVALSIAVSARAIGSGGFYRGLGAGFLLALATLARPEGAALMGIVTVVAIAFALRGGGRDVWFAAVGIVVAYLAVMGPFIAWRIGYYGYPLPNTFYVKTSGNRGEVFAHGISYIQLALREFGEPLTQVLILCVFLPARVVDRIDARDSLRTRRAAFWIMRLFTAALLPYVVWIGGDFLDLYRFLVPLFPIIFVASTFVGCRLVERFAGGRARVAGIVCALAVSLFPFTARQWVIEKRARGLSEKGREQVGVEPLGWSREYALRWSATGRWIHAHAEQDDWMATGAAGAMPFYAGIRNLDVLGLCDEFVAHHGTMLGARPGHEREAPESYMLSKRPVFLMFHDSMDDTLKPPKRDKDWESKGYVWATATVDVERYGAPKTFFHTFLMRQDRAAKLMSAEDIQTAIGAPE